MILKFIKGHKKILIDFIYSFVAYALPTIVLQFVVQPVIASKMTADENGLFITLFNVAKLMVSIFIMPLANLRLLRKSECEKNELLNPFFNTLFLVAVACTAVIGSIMNGLYRGLQFDFFDILRLLLILLLMGTHDYFMISFRLVLDYKRIVFDNCFIVAGYGIGILLFFKTGMWELIFICGYILGTAYVLYSTDLWKSPPRVCREKAIVRQYGELGASSLLARATTYCDRLIIYPVLGGFDVSVYNAAAVVSKAISVVSAPLRNVLLSYIVNHNEMTISKKKILKFIPIVIAGFAAAFGAFWGISVLACKILYAQYAPSAMPYIPIIIAAILF